MRRGETSVQGQTGAIYIAIETVAEYTEYINQTGAIYIATETVAEYNSYFYRQTIYVERNFFSRSARWFGCFLLESKAVGRAFLAD